MYCTRCNRYTDNERCPECGRETLEEAPHVVYWCDSCRVPIIHIPSGNKIQCPTCGNEAKYLCADIRPVFPEERLLFEILSAEPFAYMHESVWAIGSKYYVNGEPHNITIAEIQSFDPAEVREELDRYAEGNDDTAFLQYVSIRFDPPHLPRGRRRGRRRLGRWHEADVRRPTTKTCDAPAPPTPKQ